MSDLLNAYISDALPFALMHGGLVLVCGLIWFLDWRRINNERRVYHTLQRSGLPRSPGSTSSVEGLTRFAFSLAQKGAIPDAETLTRRLVKALSIRDAILRSCINGLIVVGLLGTLFNLWRLGPNFWNSLVEGTSPNRSAIGVAFAASFFGLLWALALNLIDNGVFRPNRGALARQSTEWIMSSAVEQLPPSKDAAVSEGLKKFTETSETILLDLKSQHAILTQSLVDQIRESSQAFDDRLTTVAMRWETFFGVAADKVKEGGQELQKAAKELTTATNHASKTLADTTKTLESYKNLSELIAQVRSESANLVSEVTRRMEQFTKQMEMTLSSVTREHAQALEHESEAANRRLSDLIDAWHTRSAATLGGFGATVQKASDDFSDNWQQLTKSVNANVDQLIRGWRSTLGDAVVDVASTLNSINNQLRNAERLSAALVQSTEALTRATEAVRQDAPKPEAMRELLKKRDESRNQSEQLIRELIRKLDTLTIRPDEVTTELLRKLNALPSEIARVISTGSPQLYQSPMTSADPYRIVTASAPNDGNRSEQQPIMATSLPISSTGTEPERKGKQRWYRRLFG